MQQVCGQYVRVGFDLSGSAPVRVALRSRSLGATRTDFYGEWPLRIRSIKPQFFRDSKILQLSPLSRLLFVGLWCCADREGRMEFDPKELRIEVLPDETQEATDACFVQLESQGMIVVYSVNNRKYLAIPNFLKHQTPYHKEQPSTCPEPDRVMTLTSQGHDRSVICHLSSVLGAVLTTSSNPPPEDLDPLSRVKPAKRNGYDPELLKFFEAFYADYPRHEGKQAALKAFVRLKPDIALLRSIVEDVGRRIEIGAWLPRDPERCKFIPLPATYLNGRRWEDGTIS